MKRENISKAVGNISARHIQEAASYPARTKKSSFFKKPFGKAVAAAVLILCFLAAGIGVLSPFHAVTVDAFTYGENEKLTSAGAVIQTGTITDDGEMKGHPLMFYLSGKDIESVRFSCKNQQIDFRDWTEKRTEYGLAQNFTVPYGKEESEYYYLTIDWVPDATIRELTDKEESTIKTLPDELREDMIVMEVTFANGKTAVKAVTVSLLDDGTFFAAFDDYKIRDTDTFLNRTDSSPIPRDLSYSQENKAEVSGNSSPEQEKEPVPATENTAEPAAEEAARTYYSGTVFEVVSIEPTHVTEKETVFSVCVSKDGVIQEPNRTITMKRKDGTWEATGEGY